MKAKVLQMMRRNDGIFEQADETAAETKMAKRLFDDCLERYENGLSCSQQAWQLRRAAKDNFYCYLAQVLVNCQRSILPNLERNFHIFSNLSLAATLLESGNSEQERLYNRVSEIADKEADIFT